MELNILSWVAYTIASIIYIYIVYFAFSSAFISRFSKKVTILICIALSVANLFLLFLNNAVLNMAISLLVLIVICQLFIGALSRRIKFAALILCVGIISEFTVGYLLASIVFVAPYDMQFGTPEFVYGIMLSRTLFAVLARIISGFARKRSLPKLKATHWIALVVPPIGSLIVLYNYLFLRTPSITDMISSMIVMITSIVVITVYGKILSDREVEVKNSYLEDLLKYYNYQHYLAEKSEIVISKTKHDIKNLLIAFKTDIQNQNVKSVQDGIDRLLGDIDSFDGPATSGNLAIDSIINYKASLSKDRGIQFLTILDIPHNLELQSVAICQIIGNALDNAVEATEKVKDEANRVIQVDISYKHDTLQIKITNPYDGIMTTDNNGILLSSKRDFRAEGIGLQSIKSIVAESGGTVNIDYEDNDFSLTVILYSVSVREEKT